MQPAKRIHSFSPCAYLFLVKGSSLKIDDTFRRKSPLTVWSYGKSEICIFKTSNVKGGDGSEFRKGKQLKIRKCTADINQHKLRKSAVEFFEPYLSLIRARFQTSKHH